MSGRKGGRRAVPRKKRGPWAAAAIFLAGAVCCWMGLVKVDQRIRAVTINQSPPLWEARAEGDSLWVTVLGRRVPVDLSPIRRAGEEWALLWETPPAPVRAVRGGWDILEELSRPQPERSWKKGFL